MTGQEPFCECPQQSADSNLGFPNANLTLYHTIPYHASIPGHCLADLNDNSLTKELQMATLGLSGVALQPPG